MSEYTLRLKGGRPDTATDRIAEVVEVRARFEMLKIEENLARIKRDNPGWRMKAMQEPRLWKYNREPNEVKRVFLERGWWLWKKTKVVDFESEEIGCP